MANNGIFYTSGNTLDFTTTGITWARLSSGGTFSSLGLSATTYYNLPFSGTVVGSGTTNYVPLWTGSTGLGNSIIQSNNSNVSINTSIDSNTLLNLYFTGTTGVYSNANDYGIYGVCLSPSGFAVNGFNNSGAGSGAGVAGGMLNGTGVYGNSTGQYGPNYGIKGSAQGSNGGTPENIAGYFESFGDGTSYSLQLKDGTEDIDKVLVSKTIDGKANWSGELNISGLTANTISATTYNNLPQSVSGTGTQDYVTKWDSSTSGITNSEIYSTSGLIGLFTSSAFYGGEIVSMSTLNKGITIDGLYLIEDGNGSIAMSVGFDYSTWNSGGNEIAIGNGNPLSSSAGQYNIAIGNRSLLSNTVGNNNVSIGGSHTLYSNITGSSNVAIGYNSLYNNTIGNYNVTIGEGTGFANSGSSNVYLGYAAGYNNDGNNNIFIGYSAGYGDTSSSNKLNIGDTIIGDLSAKSISVPTISATTYDNLPGSSSSNCYTTFYVTNISGCSPVNILSPLNATVGLNVTGTTNFINTVDFSGGLTATTISATTYQNLPVSGLTQGSNVTITNNGNGNYTISSTGGSGGVDLGLVYTTGNNINFL